ncbi:MAG: hypothetical protein ABI425_04475 [Patescibacteria group bacterium]
MNDQLKENRARVKGYDGPDDSSSLKRGINSIEKVWQLENKIQIGSLDELINQQIERAIENDQKNITILDIGSGPTGQLLTEIATVAELSLPKTKALLSAHPELTIRCTGLTDAQSIDTFFQATQLQSSETDTQVTAQNIEYTLTAKQTLEKFLEKLDVDHAELVLATFSLTYMGPKVFEQTVRTVISKLSQGGTFAVAGYAEDHPAIQRDSMGMKQLKIRNQDDDFPLLDMNEFNKKLYEQNRDYAELHEDLDKAEAFLEKIGLQKAGFLQKLKRNSSLYFEVLTGLFYDIKFKKQISFESIQHDFLNQRRLRHVSRTLWDLEKKLLIGMRQKKKEILIQLAEEFKEEIELEYTDKVFVIKKRNKLERTPDNFSKD